MGFLHDSHQIQLDSLHRVQICQDMGEYQDRKRHAVKRKKREMRTKNGFTGWRLKRNIYGEPVDMENIRLCFFPVEQWNRASSNSTGCRISFAQIELEA